MVANEVKELAKEAAKATDEIESRIASIQSYIQTAVGAIGHFNIISRTINDSHSTIASAVEEQKATTNELLRTIGSAASGNREITDVIQGVATQSVRNIESAKAINVAADDLSNYSTKLQECLARYKYDARSELSNKAF